jgi:beta-glucosidase
MVRDRDAARARAKELVAQMTLEEKASQLRYDAPAIPRLGIPAYNWWNEALHGVARAGTATVFPQAIGLAAIFDEGFQSRVAEAISDEGRAKYNMQSRRGDRGIYKGLTFWSPNINIFRDPRWGRGHETYGEDPTLTSRLGVAFVKGLQGEGKHLKAAACAKHFAVHSGPEALRHEFDARPSEKDLRETYLPAFEALVREAEVESVMGAYNRVNGEPACGSKRLLRDILRDEWGFQGHVVSDCWALRDFHTHHMVTSTAPESAALALKMGCDLNCGVTYLHLLQAHQDGLVTEDEITTACERLMTTRFLLGILGGGSEYDAIGYERCDSDENAALALEAARRSMVLLKNDGVLPLDLKKLKTVAVIGPNADSVLALEGNYNGKSSRYVTFLKGIRAACEAEGVRVLYSEGCHLFKDSVQPLCPADDRLQEAAACAEAADAVFLCVGLDSSLEGEEGDTSNAFEAGDKTNLELPESQKRLIERVMKAGKPVVTVVAAGSSVRVEDGNAILLAWYPGQAGGQALADIAFGAVSPSGKLPVTFYRTADDLPPFEDYSMAGRTYRYFRGEPLYPFGYGLSYARFELSEMRFEEWQIGITVQNMGGRDAEEVVQVYIQPLNSPFAPPNPSLCGFQRVSLKAREARRIRVDISQKAFTVVDDSGNRVPGGGRFKLYAGFGQPDARTLSLTGREPLVIEAAVERAIPEG